MKLREYRKQHNVTLADLASQVGVSEVAMSRYERGERMPRPEIMRKIETVTGGEVRPNDFISADGAAETLATDESTDDITAPQAPTPAETAAILPPLKKTGTN